MITLPQIPLHYFDSRLGVHEHFKFAGGYTDGALLGVSGGGATNTSTPPTGWVSGVIMRTGTNTVGGCYLGMLNGLYLGFGETYVQARFRTTVLSNATDAYTFRYGYMLSTNSNGANACMFRYTHSVNGGRFECVARSANVETVVDSNVVVQASTEYALRVWIDAAGTEARYFIDNALVATINTNVPSGGASPTAHGGNFIKSAGTVDTSIFIREHEFDYRYTTPLL